MEKFQQCPLNGEVLEHHFIKHCAALEGRRSHTATVTNGQLAVAALRKLGAATREDVTLDILKMAASGWRASGLSAATVNRRLAVLSKMGIDCKGAWATKGRPYKWWMRPELEAPIFADLRDHGQDGLIIYIRWAAKTGLRVEESLRLRRHHFAGDFMRVTVPGTKTAASFDTLPLGAEARAIAQERFGRSDGDAFLLSAEADLMDGPSAVLGLSRAEYAKYIELQRAWLACRRRLKIADHTATLKAFRRTAARYLHVDLGMPLGLVQQYLRHESLETTLGYLRLTGGYAEDEMRRYLG